ncbi:MAG TPA: DNA gyrase C-terminal beta-propeller domain-containing protein, partial [Thermoanaerobaculia bacterium]
TEIIPEANEITIEDMIAEEDMVITVTRGGYVKRSPLSLYRAQRRGGKGRIGMATKEEDIVEHLFVASTHSYILVFTDRGRLYWLTVHALPEVGMNARGKAFVNLLNFEPGESVRALLTTRDFTEAKYVVMVTRQGTIKKTELSAFANPRAAGIIAIDINEGDDLHSVAFSDGQSQIFIGTHEGMAIRFSEEDVRPMGRTAAGVRAITLRGGDYVVELDVLPNEEGEILTMTEGGFGKRTAIPEYRLQGRGGSGVINIRRTDKNGPVVGICHVSGDEEMLLITEQGKIIRFPTATIRETGRAAQGVRLIDVDEGDRVVGAVKLVEKDEVVDDETADEAPGEGPEEPVEPAE